MASEQPIAVELIFATPDRIWRCELHLPSTATVAQALEQGGFWSSHPQLSPELTVVGIYGQRCDQDQLLKDGDRVEIYRPLVFDPMESRRRRAIHRKAFMTKPANRPKRRKARLAAAQAQDKQPS
ncbi:MAG: RnfH family protein [Burkholderiaceae bacterium]|nr:RnfH family protein [Burkholderiaceae bacterium]